VERAWKRGVRKDLYQVKDDWYQSFVDLFSIKWRRSISFHSAAIRRSLAELEELVEDPAIDDDLREEVTIDIEKLLYLRDYYEWLDRLVDAFEDHDIFKLVPIKKPEQDTKEINMEKDGGHIIVTTVFFISIRHAVFPQSLLIRL
jgi:DNA-binding transcriptional regulator GbsR (MarR family)